MFHKQIERFYNSTRFLLDPYIDSFYLPSEQETKENCLRVRNYVRAIIKERREEMKDPNFID